MKNAKKIKAWLKLTRFEHALMSAVGVFVAIMIALKAGGEITPINFAFAMLVPICINLGAFALNDYFDIEADRENEKKERPLVSGELSATTALLTGIAGLVLGSAYGFLINFEAGIIAIVFAGISFLYNWKLKDFALIGNLFISISMGISFVFGAAVSGFVVALIPIDFWILGIGATVAGLGREIVKTVQDVEGDKKARGSKTLPVLIGEKNSLLIAGVLFAVFAICVFALWLYSQILEFNTLSLGILAICVFAYLTFAYICVFEKISEARNESIRKLSLSVLAFSLFAILISAI